MEEASYSGQTSTVVNNCMLWIVMQVMFSGNTMEAVELFLLFLSDVELLEYY